jgi:ABC-type multidrug transport system permease subunit
MGTADAWRQPQITATSLKSPPTAVAERATSGKSRRILADPFSWAVDGARALFNGNPGDPNVWKSLVILGVLTALSVLWAARSFAKSVR